MNIYPSPALSKATDPYALETFRYYAAYGLVLASAVSLPELTEVEPRTADVVINRGIVGKPKEQAAKATWYCFEDGRAVLHWNAVGTFEVLSGNEIIVEPVEDVEDDLVAFPLLGPVLAVLLHQRGLLILHASSVGIDGRGICLLGDKGAGKSTTAASLVSAGHTLLTDDIVAIEFTDGGGFEIRAGFPQIKLARDAEARINLANSRMLAQGHASIEKTRHRLTSGFTGNSVSLEKLFVLNRGDGFAVRSLSNAESLNAVIRYSYMSRFGAAALLEKSVAVHLRQCARIAGTDRVCDLSVPDDLGQLDDLVCFLEKQAGQ